MKKQKTCSSEHVQDQVDSNRRKMLKKAAYSAPKLVALGLLTRSPSVFADASGGPPGPPQPPDGWSP